MNYPLLLASCAALALLANAASAQELTVYTAIEADQLADYKAAFEADNPGITINWVRDSTGIVTAKLLAERDNPQADVIWGLAATSLMLLKAEGMLEPYAPAQVENLKPAFVDDAEVPSWVGMDAWAAAICVNTVEAERLGLPMPTSWADLTDPVYRGHVMMPNPSSSGTGFLDVSSWLQLFGEEEGWAYMDALHENIAAYTHSGSKPCHEAARGEVPIGISFEYRAARSKADGAPIEIVIPSEGIGWDMEAAAIVAGTFEQEAAQKLLDWAVSEKANRMYAQGYAVVAMPGVAEPLPHLPANFEEMLIDNDFEWAALNRERILAEWQSRYDGKTEPR